MCWFCGEKLESRSREVDGCLLGAVACYGLLWLRHNSNVLLIQMGNGCLCVLVCVSMCVVISHNSVDNTIINEQGDLCRTTRPLHAILDCHQVDRIRKLPKIVFACGESMIKRIVSSHAWPRTALLIHRFESIVPLIALLSINFREFFGRKKLFLKISLRIHNQI